MQPSITSTAVHCSHAVCSQHTCTAMSQQQQRHASVTEAQTLRGLGHGNARRLPRLARAATRACWAQSAAGRTCVPVA